MYSKSYKLYPFSKRLIPLVEEYANKLQELSEQAENAGDFEKAEELFNKSCEIGASVYIEMEGQNDKHCIWISGKKLAIAKKAVEAMSA